MIRNISSAKNEKYSLMNYICGNNGKTCNHTPRATSIKLIANRYYTNNIYNTLYKGNLNLSLHKRAMSSGSGVTKKTRNKVAPKITIQTKIHSMCSQKFYSSRVTQLMPTVNDNSCKGIMKLNLLRKYNYNCNNKYQPKRKGSQLYLANKNNSSFNKTKFVKKDNSHFNLFHKCFNITPLKKISILQRINHFKNTRKQLIMKDQSASTMGDFKYVSV